MDNIHHDEDVIFTQDSLIGFIKCIKSDIRDTYHFVSVASMKSKDVSQFNDDEKEIAQIFVDLWNYKYDQQICIINQQIELIKDESGNIDIQKNQNSKRYTWIIGGNKLVFSPEEANGVLSNKLSGTFQIQENDNTNKKNIRVQGFDNNGDFSNYQYVEISQPDLTRILNCPNEESFKNLENLSNLIFYQKKNNNSYERLNSFDEIKNVAILSDQNSYGEDQQGYQGIVLYYAEVVDGGGTIRTNTLECDNLFTDSATLNNLNIIGDGATSFNSSLAIKDQTEADRWIETTEDAISDGWTYNIINKDENSNYILSTNNDSDNSLTDFNFAVKENYQKDSDIVGYKIKNIQTVRCTGGNSQQPSSSNQQKVINDLKLKINNQNQDVEKDQIYDADYKNFFIIIQTTYTSSYSYRTGYYWANPIEKKINLFDNSAGINFQDFLEELTSITKYKYLGFINKNTDNIYDSSQTYYEEVAPSDIYDFEFTNYDNLDESSWNSAISENNIFRDSYEKNNDITYNIYDNNTTYNLFEEEAPGTEITGKQTYYKLSDNNFLEEVTLENTTIRNTEHYYKTIKINNTVNLGNFYNYIGQNQLFGDNNKLITYFNYNNNINYYIKDSDEHYILIEGLNNKSDYEINKLLKDYSNVIKNKDIYKRIYNNLPAPNMEDNVDYKGIEIAQINKYFNVVRDPSRTNIYNLYEEDEYGSYKKVINEPNFDNTKEYYYYDATCYEKVNVTESTWNSKIQEGLYIYIEDNNTFYLLPNYNYPGQIANQDYYQLTAEASPFKYYQYNKVSIDDYDTIIEESGKTYQQQIEYDIINEGLYYSQSNNWIKLNNFNNYSSTVNYYTLNTDKITKIQKGEKPTNWKWLALSGIYSIEDGNYIRISTPFVEFDSSKNYYIASSYINDSSLDITTEGVFNTYRDDENKILLKVQKSSQEFVNFNSNDNKFEIVDLPEFIHISKYQLYNPEDTTTQYYQRISNLDEIKQGYQNVYLKKYYYSSNNWDNKKYNLYIYRNNIYNKHKLSNDYIRCEIGKYYSLDSDFYKRELIINGENVSNQTVQVRPAPGLGLNDAHVSGSITTLGGISARKSIMGFKVHGAVFNDYAEYRHTNNVAPGRCVIEVGDGDLEISKQRLQLGANIVSDTFGFSIGESNYANTPIAVCGRVLAYPLEGRSSFKPGQAVCSGPNGTISVMTRDEIKEWPDAIIGYVSEIPVYKYWGSDNIEVDGRIWIKVK